jgi:hypothetical protein
MTKARKALGIEARPILDERGFVVVFDLWVAGQWVGSRRTAEQCEEWLSYLCGQPLRCIVCGGEHQPTSAMYCDEDGMDREIARMGSRQWNRITGQVMRALNRRPVGETEGNKEE